jgi:beta-aspartyl-peptidase (threonine type)
MSDSSCSLIVHGGAWEIPDSATEDCKAGCRRALEAGWKVLQGGGLAVEAVEAAIVVLEDDPVFDAGYGSHLNREGRVQLDAIIMDGRTLDAGSVAAVERVKNPIRLARRVMERSAHILLVGEGAEQFAEENGIPLCSNEELICPRERESWQRCIQSQHEITRHFAPHVTSHGTVGAVARDARGDIVAATSTGGTCCKLPGRVGDSPLIGCGAYADIEAGGVSCTGYGEAIMRIVMAKTAVDMMHPLAGNSAISAQGAAEASVRLLAERGRGTGGLVLLDRNGRPGFAFNTPHMAYGYMAGDSSFIVGV